MRRGRLVSAGKLLLVLTMSLAYIMLFYNASARDNNLDSSDLYKGNIDWASLILSFFLGCNQIIEISDHAMGSHHHGHSHGEPSNLPVLSINTPVKTSNRNPLKILKIAVPSAIALGLGAFGALAIWNQALSFGQGNPIIASAVFIPNLLRYLLMPGKHIKALITGTEQELMHEVTDTGSDDDHEDQHESAIPIWKKIFLLVLYSLCHVADSLLLANESTKQSVIYWLSVVALSISVGCYHITHTLNLPRACKKLQKLSCGKKSLAFILAFFTGGLHGAQSLMGLLHLIKTNRSNVILMTQMLAILVEFITGSIDGLQHLSPWMIRQLEVDALHHAGLWNGNGIKAALLKNDSPELHHPGALLM